MKFATLTLAAATAVVLCGAAYADSIEPPTLAGCTHMRKKVEAALSAAEQSPRYDQARRLADRAKEYCSTEMFKVGVDQYAKALSLLSEN